jgi:hypothetical protein
VKLIAKTALRYASRDLRAGERFDASESDAFVLKAVGKADDAPQPVASQDDERPDGKGRSGRGGRYKRADMRVED